MFCDLFKSKATGKQLTLEDCDRLDRERHPEEFALMEKARLFVMNNKTIKYHGIELFDTRCYGNWIVGPSLWARYVNKHGEFKEFQLDSVGFKELLESYDGA